MTRKEILQEIKDLLDNNTHIWKFRTEKSLQEKNFKTVSKETFQSLYYRKSMPHRAFPKDKGDQCLYHLYYKSGTEVIIMSAKRWTYENAETVHALLNKTDLRTRDMAIYLYNGIDTIKELLPNKEIRDHVHEKGIKKVLLGHIKDTLGKCIRVEKH